MMKSKKGLSGVLAVLMLVSMLSCFALPVTAAEANGIYYYVSSAKEWNDLAEEINANNDNLGGKEIHIQNDISFKDVSLTAIVNFKGTLDGHGYKFTNISSTSFDGNPCGARLIKNLNNGGVIQNLTLDASCSFTNTSTWLTEYSGYTNPSGAFVSSSNGGTIKNCGFYATYTINSSLAGATHLGGFVGKVNDNGVTIDGCIFDGTVTNTVSGATANAFVGKTDGGGTVTIKNSIARGTLTAAKTGTDAANFENSYAVVAEGGSYGTTDKIKTDLNEAVWIVNDQREQNVNDGIYLNVDGDGKPCFGNTNNRVVRVTIKDGENDSDLEHEFYAPRMKVEKMDEETGELKTITTVAQTYFDLPEAVEWTVSGAERRENRVYIDHRDITVTSGEDTTSNDTETSETENSGGYPSIKNYDPTNTAIKDYGIKDADEWMEAVRLSNHVTTPNATDFSGITLHVVDEIDLTGKDVLPLGYGGHFDGNLDGHGNVIYNLNMEIDSPYGPVGLISVLAKKRTVQNVSIGNGSIKVTGLPRYKYDVMGIDSPGNNVGGIVGCIGKNNKSERSVIRKCWNNADIAVKNETYVAGILGESLYFVEIDSCINQGSNTGHGILGYGATRGMVYNSISGVVDGTATTFSGSITGTDLSKPETLDPETVKNKMEENISNTYGVKLALKFRTYGSGETKKRRMAAEKIHNDQYTVMSEAAAGWAVNANYQRKEKLGTGERIYYTLDDYGNVQFGAPDGSGQIYRIKMVCDLHGATCTEHPVRYAYGIAGQSIPLSFDLGANYYACDIKDVEGVTINKENVLNFSKDVIIKVDETLQGKEKAEAAMTIPVYVDYNADRGNVNDKPGIDILDALDAVKMVVYPNTAVLKTADVNSNHGVDILDAYQIIRYALLNNKGGNYTPTFAAGTPTKTKDQYLKVLSYNIKSCYYDPYYDTEDGNGTPFSRFGPIMEELKKIDADIMGFQEIIAGHSVYSEGKNVLETICKSLNTWKGAPADDPLYRCYYTPSRYYTDDHENGPTAGNGIISKYPILESGKVPFGGNGWTDNSERNLDTPSVPRTFTWHQIDVDGNGYKPYKDKNGNLTGSQDIIFYNTHLSTGYTTNGISGAQLQYILQYMQEHHANDRVVCTGDMNLGAYHTKDVLDKVNTSSGGNTSVAQKFIALNGDKNHNTYTRTNPNSGSMVDNIIVSENVEYFKFGESKFSASPALNTSTALYGSDYSYGNMNSYREAYEQYYDTDSGKHFLPVRDPSELVYDESSGKPTNGVSNEIYADDPQWTASDHMPIWAYIKK